MSDLIEIGPYYCMDKEPSRLGEVIVVFRNSLPQTGGNGLFRMSKEQSDHFEVGKCYELFGREAPESKFPLKLPRKSK